MLCCRSNSKLKHTPPVPAIDRRGGWVLSGFSHLPTLTAVAVAILTTGLKTFKYQENWINYRSTCETLRKEKRFYDAGLGDYGNTKDKEALFVDRVESMISRENTMWVRTHKPEIKTEEENADS